MRSQFVAIKLKIATIAFCKFIFDLFELITFSFLILFSKSSTSFSKRKEWISAQVFEPQQLSAAYRDKPRNGQKIFHQGI